jgi:hypothetical protein
VNFDLSTRPGQLALVVGAAGVVVALALAALVVRVVRRADRRQLLVVLVTVLAVAIGAVAFQSSLT